MGTILLSCSCPSLKLKLHNLHSSSKLHNSIRPYHFLSLPNYSLKSKLKFSSSSSSSSLSSSMADPIQASASSTAGLTNERLKDKSSGLVGEHDLLIVGPGVLGRLVAQQWREEFPGCQVHGQTMTPDHHEELIKIGINPSLKETKPSHQFPYVIFCAPPSRSSDYIADVREAASSWNREGCFLFTSSSAPFDCFDNGECDEDSPIVELGRSPRTDVLLKAEKVVLESEGSVLRLAGLYKGTVDVRPDNILNLIHYEDAASLSIAILKKKFRARVFLGCDNHPVSRQEVMDLVAKSGKFSKKFEAFTGTSDPLGKKLNNSKTRKEVEWEPKYPSFAHFLGVSE